SYDPFSDLFRDDFIMRYLKGMGRPALAHRAQAGRIPEDLRERNKGVDDLQLSAYINAFYPSAARINVIDYIPRIFDRTHYLKLHHRLHERGTRSAGALLQRDIGGYTVRHADRAVLIIGPSRKSRRYIIHFIPRYHAGLHGVR